MEPRQCVDISGFSLGPPDGTGCSSLMGLGPPDTTQELRVRGPEETREEGLCLPGQTARVETPFLPCEQGCRKGLPSTEQGCCVAPRLGPVDQAVSSA